MIFGSILHLICGIPPRLLKELSHKLSPSLTLIFRASIHQSSLSLDWKTALVTLLFKKGSRSNPTNYSPISPTSIIYYKLLEYIIYSKYKSKFYLQYNLVSIKSILLSYNYFIQYMTLPINETTLLNF